MRSSKFVQSLKVLDGFQIKRLKKFLESPYFNRKEELCILFNYLVKSYPDFSSDRLCKDVILKDPGLKKYYSDKPGINKGLNHLNKLFEQFIYFESERHNYRAHQLAISKFYGGKGLDKAFEKSIGLFPTCPQDVVPLISEELHHGYLNQKNLLGVLTSKIFRSNSLDGISSAEEFLDAYYYLEKLRLNCEKESRRLLYGLNPKDITKWSNLLYLPDPKLHDLPALDIFYQLNLMLSGSINEGIDAIIEKTRLKISTLSKEDTQSIIYLMLNYCVYQINHGQTEYNQQYLRINKILIENNYLLEQGNIAPHRFKNIVSAGIEVGEHDWTHQFIEDFKPYLPIHNRELFYRISIANLMMAMNHVEEAHEHLVFLETKLQYENVTIRKLKMKVFFVKEEWDLLDSHIKSFEQFIRRNKHLPENVKTSYKRMTHYTAKLMDVRLGKHVNLKELYHEIEQEVKTNDRGWLLSHLEKEML